MFMSNVDDSIESHLANQVDAARKRAAAARPVVRTVGEMLGAIAPAPTREHRFNERLDSLEAKLNGYGIDPSILIKVARALAEARIEEAVVWRITAAAVRAGKPGAYFVSAVKREFARVSLPWFEEEWA